MSSACTSAPHLIRVVDPSGFLVANSETGDFCIVALCYLNGDCNFIHINVD